MRTNQSFFILSLLLTLSLKVSAQNDGPTVYIVDYLKVAVAGEELDTDVWADLHRQRKADGVILDWQLYQIRSSDTASEYDYVTVTTVKGLGAFDTRTTSGNMNKCWNDLSAEQKAVVENADSYWDLIRTDVLIENDVFGSENCDAGYPPQCLVVNFIDIPAGGMDTYMSMEKNLARPMYEDMMKAASNRTARGIYNVFRPSGTDRPYDVITVDFFNEWSGMASGGIDYQKRFEEVHPTLAIDHYDAQIYGTCTRTECWVLVDYL